MINAINFVQRAVIKKSVTVQGGNFTIENGRIFAYNGLLTASAVINVPIDCKPKADTFTAIIKASHESNTVPSFSITPTGKLSVKAGKLKALIECNITDVQEHRPEGIDYPIDGEDFMGIINLLEPFMGNNTDPTKSWANSIMLNGNKAYVTCNTIAIEHTTNLDIAMPIVIPSQAIKELIKIKKFPISVRYCAKSITFFYDDDSWLKTRTLENKFPNFDPVLNTTCIPIELPEDFYTGLKQLKSFCDEEFNSICFTSEGLITKNEAVYEINLPITYGIYNYNLLILLESIMKKIDFSSYPKPAIFIGDRIRGCIVGYAR
jgi:hypothetical protein